MSILFGGIRQIGMVVHDHRAAMESWGRMGIGPFFELDFTFDDFVYRGQPSSSPQVTLCFAHSGPVQIELIKQHDDAPSVYREFLESGHEGAQHVCAWFADHPAYDAARSQALDRGFVIAQEGQVRAFGTRFAYFETGEPGGMMFEISEALMPGLDESVALMEAAARQWDGLELLAPIGSPALRVP